MVTKQAKTDCHNNFLCFTLITLCLFGMILAQTFQYSRGWTNGKKRSSFGSFLLQDAGEGQELYGICQIQRLKEIFENRQLNREYLPCEVIDKTQVDYVNRHRRKGDCDQNFILDSLLPQAN